MIERSKQNCKARYVGKTERFLHDRICEHIGDVRTRKLEKPVAKHFNLPGHSLSDITATIIEKVKANCPQYRKEGEKYLVTKFNLF